MSESLLSSGQHRAADAADPRPERQSTAAGHRAPAQTPPTPPMCTTQNRPRPHLCQDGLPPGEERTHAGHDRARDAVHLHLRTAEVVVAAIDVEAAEDLIDPVQGVQAYEEALQKAGNQEYQVVTIPKVGHVFTSAPEYLETMEAWLQNLMQANQS